MPAERASSRRVWEIDLVRVLTFTAVVGVHGISATQSATNVAAMGSLMLLHFTREAFFAITGFVLVWSNIGKTVRARTFWRKRVPYVLVPYLTWSLLYYWFGMVDGAGHPWSWAALGQDLLYGTAEYHLYFLIVTIQIYLVFPYLIRFIRFTARFAMPVLAVALVCNLAWFGVLQYGDFHGWLFSHAYELFPTYLIYVLAGAYAAMHWDRVRSVLASFRRHLLALAGMAMLVALGAYAVQLGRMNPTAASSVTQPATFASCVSLILLLCLLAQWWVAAGMPGRATLSLASEISFGVYLAHPFFLQMLLDHGLWKGDQAVPSPLATVIAIVGAIVGASALALAVRRTPLAFPLIGRTAVRSRPATRSVPVSRPSPALPAALDALGQNGPFPGGLTPTTPVALYSVGLEARDRADPPAA
jgi:peptidoglycan/LPS O-acetylase OafA/YrhL